MTEQDPMYAEEACWVCGGDGCETCNDTGLLYTDAAIRLQIEAAEKAENDPAAESDRTP